MTSSLRFLAIAGLLACAPVAGNCAAQLDPSAQVEKMGRGLNILGYDPLWDDFAKARIHERHFQIIHEAGFHTLRVNLMAFDHMDAQNRLDPAWLKALDWVVKTAVANDLIVILDEHDYNFCGEHADVCRTKLLAFWQQVAEIYKDAPASVVFEILNEPNSQLNADRWNALMNETLMAIRISNSTRNVVIGPAYWNAMYALDKLALPENDQHIIVTVHYYAPMAFTHQGASWSKMTAQLSDVKWGTDADKQRVVDDFAFVQRWSKAHNRPILLGEFGAYDKGPMESRALYTSCVARAAEALGWAWTYFQFDINFLAWDMDKDAWVEPIRKALIPDSAKP
jgi:endoglucanase